MTRRVLFVTKDNWAQVRSVELERVDFHNLRYPYYQILPVMPSSKVVFNFQETEPSPPPTPYTHMHFRLEKRSRLDNNIVFGDLDLTEFYYQEI